MSATPQRSPNGSPAKPSVGITLLGILAGAAVYGILMALRHDAAGDRWARILLAAAAGVVFGLLLTWAIKRARGRSTGLGPDRNA